MRGEIIKKNNRIINISGTVEFRMFISVRTIPLLEFVIIDLEGVPWWTLLSNDVIRFDSIRCCCCCCCVVLSELTSCSTDSIHSILLLALLGIISKRKSDEAKATFLVIVLNEKQVFTSIAITSPTLSRKP